MFKISERKEEILLFLQPYMEECFQKSCGLIQSEIEIHGNEIWKELKAAIGKVLQILTEAQEKQQKGAIQYLVFSFLKGGIYIDKIIFHLGCLDEQFYMDEEETATLCNITFLEDKYMNDIFCLYHKAKEKFIRLQEYELLYINERYATYYYAIAYQMIESLTELIQKEIIKSHVRITDKFKILYGEYMDTATVVYPKEQR